METRLYESSEKAGEQREDEQLHREAVRQQNGRIKESSPGKHAIAEKREEIAGLKWAHSRHFLQHKSDAIPAGTLFSNFRMRMRHCQLRLR